MADLRFVALSADVALFTTVVASGCATLGAVASLMSGVATWGFITLASSTQLTKLYQESLMTQDPFDRIIGGERIERAPDEARRAQVEGIPLATEEVR